MSHPAMAYLFLPGTVLWVALWVVFIARLAWLDARLRAHLTKHHAHRWRRRPWTERLTWSDLGIMYDTGRGVPQDYAEAVMWYRKAAEQGDASGQYNLGLMYDNGRGLPLNYSEAAEWYRKAAEQGVAAAQHNLGVMYDNGQGVVQDDAEAAEWYRKAAEQGVAPAQHNLGVMYADGRGVPQDYVQSHMWFSLAVARFTASETEGRKMAIRDRDRVATKMTAAQIAEAERLAREWKPK